MMKTLKETADLIQLSYEALRKRVQRKQLKAKKIGSQWFITTQTLKKLKQETQENA